MLLLGSLHLRFNVALVFSVRVHFVRSPNLQVLCIDPYSILPLNLAHVYVSVVAPQISFFLRRYQAISRWMIPAQTARISRRAGEEDRLPNVGESMP